MKLPARGVEIVDALYRVNPQDDAARRIAIQQVGEQMAHELGMRWGNKKRAGLSDSFRSPDSLAYLEDDQTVSVWDVQAASGQILVHADKPPDHPRLSPDEATFMPCEPVDHLGVEPDPVPAPGPIDPTPGTPDLRELRMMLTDALVSLEELKATVGVLSGLLASLQMRHDPVPLIQDLQREVKTLELVGGIPLPYRTATLRNPKGQQQT